MPAPISFRAATLADAEALAQRVVDRVEGYRGRPARVVAAVARDRDRAPARDMWGSGLARSLFARGVDAARLRDGDEEAHRGEAAPAGPRRFYEREGWVRTGDEFFDPVPGLALLEYTLAPEPGDDSATRWGSSQVHATGGDAG